MERPKRKQNRLTEYDYSTPNAYFITICTRNRRNLFWQDVGAAIGRPEDTPLTNLGMVVNQVIHDIPGHYPAITVDHAVIMPNHIHLLLQINTGCRRAANGRPYNLNGDQSNQRRYLKESRFSRLAKRLL